MSKFEFKRVNSLIEVFLQIERDINDSLEQDMSEVVKETMQRGIVDVVYNAKNKPEGAPFVYIRRGENPAGRLGSGSLSDPQTMEVNLVERCVLEVINRARPKAHWNTPYSLAYNIVHGYGSRNRWFNVERDFITAAEDMILADDLHTQSLRKSLINRGYTLE